MIEYNQSSNTAITHCIIRAVLAHCATAPSEQGNTNQSGGSKHTGKGAGVRMIRVSVCSLNTGTHGLGLTAWLTFQLLSLKSHRPTAGTVENPQSKEEPQSLHHRLSQSVIYCSAHHINIKYVFDGTFSHRGMVDLA